MKYLLIILVLAGCAARAPKKKADEYYIVEMDSMVVMINLTNFGMDSVCFKQADGSCR